jgi:hypothetical protein
MVLRFLRFDKDQDAYEAEIFDPANRQPFRAQTPVWMGKIDPRRGPGISFSADADGKQSPWAFALAPDDQPEIFCHAAKTGGGVFPARDIPLFAVKAP